MPDRNKTTMKFAVPLSHLFSYWAFSIDSLGAPWCDCGWSSSRTFFRRFYSSERCFPRVATQDCNFAWYQEETPADSALVIHDAIQACRFHEQTMILLWWNSVQVCDGTVFFSGSHCRSHTSLLDFHTPHNTWNTIPHCISFIYASPHSWSLKYKFYWAQCDAGKSKFRSPQHGSSSLRILHTQWRTEAMMLVFRTGMIILHQSENVECERCCVLIKLSELHNCRSSFVQECPWSFDPIYSNIFM